ncbi:MAG: hypothetical protein AAF146_24475, partial [Bacteroidota bacterium]
MKMKITRPLTPVLWLGILGFLGLGPLAKAQKLPQSNIYLFEFKTTSDSTMRFDQAAYLTSFNPLGYNNQ